MGKRRQLRLLSDALTGEWRNGEAGEGRGSEPCEPGGLCHQAGGAPPRVLPRSRTPFGLLCGGGSPVPFHPTWLGAARPPWGGCGRGDPSPTPPCALLRAGFARCGGGTRVPGGGRFLPGCGASGVGRSPTPDHLSLRACGRGPLPTGCGCGECGCGDPPPTPQRALASWLCALWGRHEGARGGAPLAWVWGVRGRVISHPRPLVLSGVRPGPTTH